MNGVRVVASEGKISSPTDAHGADASAPSWFAIAAAVIGSLVVVYSYWPILTVTAGRWGADEEYSHGFIVPLFSVYLLWTGRRGFAPSSWRPTYWGGLLIATGGVVKLTSAYLYLEPIEMVSFVITLMGVAAACGGVKALAWCGPAIGYLIFMVPLPYSAEVALQEPLKDIGTKAATFFMQLTGLPAINEPGNVILIGDEAIHVANACSGLRMTVTFFAIAAAIAIISDRPPWQRAAVMLAALPIALTSNIVRISVTGYLYGIGRGDWADAIFHDLAGWLMMPLALGQCYFLLWFLDGAFIVEDEVRGPLGVDTGGAVGNAV